MTNGKPSITQLSLSVNSSDDNLYYDHSNYCVDIYCYYCYNYNYRNNTNNYNINHYEDYNDNTIKTYTWALGYF